MIAKFIIFISVAVVTIVPFTLLADHFFHAHSSLIGLIAGVVTAIWCAGKVG